MTDNNTDKNDKKQPQHDPDSKRVAIWIASAVLDRWDVFCGKNSYTRTQLIKGAVNEFLRTHDSVLGSNHGEILKLQEQLAEYQEQLKTILAKATEEAGPVTSDDLDIKGRILVYFERDALLEIKRFSKLTGIEPRRVIKILGLMLKDNLVSVNSNGEWSKS